MVLVKTSLELEATYLILSSILFDMFQRRRAATSLVDLGAGTRRARREFLPYGGARGAFVSMGSVRLISEQNMYCTELAQLHARRWIRSIRQPARIAWNTIPLIEGYKKIFARRLKHLHCCVTPLGGGIPTTLPKRMSLSLSVSSRALRKASKS